MSYGSGAEFLELHRWVVGGPVDHELCNSTGVACLLATTLVPDTWRHRHLQGFPEVHGRLVGGLIHGELSGTQRHARSKHRRLG